MPRLATDRDGIPWQGPWHPPSALIFCVRRCFSGIVGAASCQWAGPSARHAVQCCLHALMLCLLPCPCPQFECSMLAMSAPACWSADELACEPVDAGHPCELVGPPCRAPTLGAAA
jgi:hypothetical protein